MPVPDEEQAVNIYCCGPTVYRDAHVGNLRTFLLADLISRALKLDGRKVNLIQNITDVGHLMEDFQGEDKLLQQAQLEKRDPFEIARKYEAGFHQDLARINILAANSYPRASETIDLMLQTISQLIASGHAYESELGSVYFDARSFPSEDGGGTGSRPLGGRCSPQQAPIPVCPSSCRFRPQPGRVRHRRGGRQALGEAVRQQLNSAAASCA
jgi:cysteinyl-tRNA synthetase